MYSLEFTHGGGVGAFFVGYVVDCQGVFVVAVADVTAVVLFVWAAVDDALRIVDVAFEWSVMFYVR